LSRSVEIQTAVMAVDASNCKRELFVFSGFLVRICCLGNNVAHKATLTPADRDADMAAAVNVMRAAGTRIACHTPSHCQPHFHNILYRALQRSVQRCTTCPTLYNPFIGIGYLGVTGGTFLAEQPLRRHTFRGPSHLRCLARLEAPRLRFRARSTAVAHRGPMARMVVARPGWIATRRAR
jgi:hypothetical protein